MPTVLDALKAVERLAPPEFAVPIDKVGLQVGDAAATVSKAVVSLDRSFGAIEACIAGGAELLVSHHPLLFHPVLSVTTGDDVGRTIQLLLKHGISHIAAHTNWDCAVDGLNDELARRLDLTDLTTFGMCATLDVLKLVTFCPVDQVDALMDAASQAGAGVIGDYQRCGFSVSGVGTFEAGQGAKPAVGVAGARNQVAEARLEMELPRAKRASVEAAIRAVHPYQEPVIDFVSLADRFGGKAGRKGRLPKPMSPAEFVSYLDAKLNTKSLGWVAGDRPIEWVGLEGGAADDDWRVALSQGCDAFVTGEVKQHNALEATALGIHIFSSGHYATEHPGVEWLAERLRQSMPSIEWSVYVPEPGTFGRPL